MKDFEKIHRAKFTMYGGMKPATNFEQNSWPFAYASVLFPSIRERG